MARAERGVVPAVQVPVVQALAAPIGQPRRIVEPTVVINGQRVRATGTLCQEADGHWAMAPRSQP